MRWSVVLLMAGCGGASSAPDAGLELDGEVTVTVGARLDGQDDTVTLYASADGTLGAPVTAAVGEVVELGVVSGGAVTVVYQGESRTTSIAYLAVEPGDALVTGDRPAAEGASGSLRVTWPAAADATGYVVQFACGDTYVTELAADLSFDPGCGGETVTDVLVYAREGSRTIAWARLDEVALGGEAAIAAWSPTAAFTITVENADPLGAYVLVASAVVANMEAELIELIGSNTAATITGSGDWVQGAETWVAGSFQREGFDGRMIRSDVLPGDSDGWILDGAALGPGISQPAKNGDYLQWTQEHDDYDGAIAVMSWARGIRDYEWVGIAPPGFGMRMPPVPDAFAGTVPLPSDGVVELAVRLQDFDADADYAALRARPTWQILRPRGFEGLPSWNEGYSASTATGYAF